MFKNINGKSLLFSLIVSCSISPRFMSDIPCRSKDVDELLGTNTPALVDGAGVLVPTPTINNPNPLYRFLWGHNPLPSADSANVEGALSPGLVGVQPTLPFWADGYSFATFVANLPDWRFFPSLSSREDIFAQIRGRFFVRGASWDTYASVNSAFLSYPRHIESFVNFLLFTSKTTAYVGMPMAFSLFVASHHELQLHLYLDVLKVFLATQYTWPYRDWLLFVESLTSNPCYPETYRLYTMSVYVEPFLSLIDSHLIVVDHNLTNHYHLDLDRVRALSALEFHSPVSPPWRGDVRENDNLLNILKKALMWLYRLNRAHLHHPPR